MHVTKRGFRRLTMVEFLAGQCYILAAAALQRFWSNPLNELAYRNLYKCWSPDPFLRMQGDIPTAQMLTQLVGPSCVWHR